VRGGLKRGKKNPSGIEFMFIRRINPTKDSMADSSVPMWANEWDEMEQFTSWTKSRPWWSEGHIWKQRVL